MTENSFQGKVITAAKWSTITQVASKIISPLTNMILARILAPEAFGVIATITMITSFVEMFTDAGFQKYLVQREFKSDDEKHKSANVAFLTNLMMSIIFWIVIVIAREPIAVLVGNPGMGNVVAVACFQLPLTAFSSIQMALYRRDFDFKTLFIVRMVSTGIPFIVTIPLAMLGLSYWALVIGNILMYLSNAIVLTIKSKWKPNFYYNIKILKEMFSFSIWSLIEAISIWLTVWIDAFIIANVLSNYHLGIYKTSTTMVNALMSLITASVVPILFSALSRLQDNNEMFNRTYFKVQRLVALFVFPIGIGVFLYSDLATSILLGNKWGEASKVVGIWALTSSIMIVLGNFSSEVYRAKGKPKLSFLAQMLHLIVLVPTCLISSKYGFLVLVYARSLIRLQFVLVHFFLMRFVIGIPMMQTVRNITPLAISAALTGGFGYFLRQMNEGLAWNLGSILLCVMFYFGIVLLFSGIRQEVRSLSNRVLSRKQVYRA
ncbi:lipopolysaccharide biosynthesis protein [Ectobacillus ponti]|uniref:Lipopolysaccharide biosynthesis protein n=1 Tax=Ectobacillus ponti TaxID=2961894 RepID=A0AA41X739_9BACI|nr:lipopolysaccharide biosynthesis protein [Ectobacillus ponti]